MTSLGAPFTVLQIFGILNSYQNKKFPNATLIWFYLCPSYIAFHDLDPACGSDLTQYHSFSLTLPEPDQVKIPHTYLRTWEMFLYLKCRSLHPSPLALVGHSGISSKFTTSKGPSIIDPSSSHPTLCPCINWMQNINHSMVFLYTYMSLLS